MILPKTILFSLVAASFAAAQDRVLLENFEPPEHRAPNVWRMGKRSHPLFEPYRGRNKDQTASLVNIEGNHFMRVEIGPNPGPRTSEWTVHVMGNEPIYPYPDGFLAHWAKGAFSPEVNRMSFWLRCSFQLPGKPPGAQNFNIGTYIKPNIPGTPRGQGVHYYHYWSMPTHPGRWMFMEMNDVPTIQLAGGSGANRAADPAYWNPHYAQRTHYFESLTRIYFTTTQYKSGNYYCDLDDLYFYAETDEPSGWVKSISVVHNGAAYELGWDSIKGASTIYEVRYSTSGSIKARGWSSGTAGGTTKNPGTTYAGTLWTSPPMPEKGPICFAIKPRMNILGLSSHSTPQRQILVTLFDSAPLGPNELVRIEEAKMPEANGFWNVAPKTCSSGEAAGERRCLWRTLPPGKETLKSFRVDAGGVSTLETSTPHGLYPGQWVFVRGPGPMNAHKNFQVLSAPTPVTFTLNTVKQGFPQGEQISGGGGWLIREVDAFWLTGSNGRNDQWVDAGGTMTTTAETGAFAEICYTPRGLAPAGSCDLNHDGAMNAADLHLAQAAAEGLAPCIGDIDRDSDCDSIDLAWMARATNGGPCQQAAEWPLWMRSPRSRR